jgi:hypothetical protein
MLTCYACLHQYQHLRLPSPPIQKHQHLRLSDHTALAYHCRYSIKGPLLFVYVHMHIECTQMLCRAGWCALKSMQRGGCFNDSVLRHLHRPSSPRFGLDKTFVVQASLRWVSFCVPFVQKRVGLSNLGTISWIRWFSLRAYSDSGESHSEAFLSSIPKHSKHSWVFLDVCLGQTKLLSSEKRRIDMTEDLRFSPKFFLEILS